MTSHSLPPGSKRPRQENQSPESAPARKTTRKTPHTQSEATTTLSSTSYVASDTTMEVANDSVLFESSAPAPQNHHTHPVTGVRPTQGTAAWAQTLAAAFNTGRASTPLSQTTSHWTQAPSMPSSLMSGGTLINTNGNFNTSDAFLRHAGTPNNSPATSPTRGRRPSADADSVGSSSRRSSIAEISLTHHHDHHGHHDHDARYDCHSDKRRQGTFRMPPLAPRTCSHDPFASFFDIPHRPVLTRIVGLTLPQAQCLQAQGFSVGALCLRSNFSSGPGPAAFVSHRATFMGASSRPGELFALDRAPNHYCHPTAESEDETILERPSTRRGRGSSGDLLRAQEAVRRQKEEDADDELAGNNEDDDDDDDEEDEDKVDEEDGMDLN